MSEKTETFSEFWRLVSGVEPTQRGTECARNPFHPPKTGVVGRGGVSSRV